MIDTLISIPTRIRPWVWLRGLGLKNCDNENMFVVKSLLKLHGLMRVFDRPSVLMKPSDGYVEPLLPNGVVKWCLTFN